MKKLFLICLSALMTWNLSAQVAQTFVPDENEVYYLKSQSESAGRATDFLIESLNALTNDVVTYAGDITGAYALAFEPMSKEIAFDTEYAQWKVKYVQDKGYMIWNVESGNYWKYVGAKEPDAEDPAKFAHIHNGICTAPLMDAEIDRFYFEFRPTKNPYEIGNDDVSFSIQGYSIIAVGTVEVKTQTLDIYNFSESRIGTWDYKGNSSGDQNQYWWFLKQSDFAQWEKGAEAAKLPFIPEENQAYYIKNTAADRGFKTRYLMQDADSLIFKTMDDQTVKTLDAYKWYLELDKETTIYRIKNKATGDYIKYVGASDEGGKHQLVKMGGIEDDRSDFTFQKTVSKIVIGIEEFPEVPSFSKQPYYLGFNFSPGKGLDGADREANAEMSVRVSAWDGGNTDANKNWIFMTDGDIDAYSAAVNDGKFILEEDAYYTIRPENLAKSEPEDVKNTRLIDDGGWVMFDQYNLEDEGAQWQFIPVSGKTGKYFVVNRLTGQFLTIGKWSNPAGSSTEENEEAARNAIYTAPATTDLALKQELSVVFSKYVMDEYGKASKVFGIANENVLPESLNGEESKPFYLDYLNKYAAYDYPGVWSGSLTPGDNQMFLIRTIEQDQASSAKSPISAKSYVFANNKDITIITSDMDALISVYTVNGVLVKRTTEKQFTLVNPGFYIVKVNMDTFKVIVK